MLFQEHQHTMPFRKWLWKEKENRILIIVSAIVLLIQFSWFKYLYPYPNFIDESSRYIETAHNNTAIGYLPIGYSKFIRFVSSFNSSHLLLIFVQYFSLQAAILYLAFSVKYLSNVDKWITRIILAFCVLNPLLLHIANLVSADAWFCTLSLVWLSQMLWLLYNPNVKLLIGHITVLLLAFITSHQAMYYPFISFLVLAFLHWKTKIKVAGITVIVLLLLAYIGRTQYEYKKLTGKVQYSALRGWQQAANVLAVYIKASPIDAKYMPTRFKELHTSINLYMDSARRQSLRRIQPALFYQWHIESPLIYFQKINKNPKDSTGTTSLKQWASLGPLYTNYARLIRTENKDLFQQHYLLANLLKFYVPDPEAMGKYNIGEDTIEKKSANWFGLKSHKLHHYSRDNWMYLPRYFPPLSALINLVFIFCIIAFFLLRKYQTVSPFEKNVLLLIGLVWLANLIFSILDAYVTLRHQTFPTILILMTDCLLITYIARQTVLKKDNYQSIDLSDSAQLNTISPGIK